MTVLLEVCVDTIDGARAADRGGADRIELNARLDLDGLTPAIDLVARMPDLPVVAMVRSRAGVFEYDNAELETMCAQARALMNAGVAGLVFGAVRGGVLDRAACARLREIAADGELVLHRAFDIVRDQFDAIEQAIGIGFDRVLTSGGAPTAHAGADRIHALRERSAGRIEILPGAGVRAENVEELVRVTGCNQVHGSFRDGQGVTDEEAVRSVRAMLDATC